jgi:fructoselysine-6-P-deglycase FrlB-like protein
VNPRGFLDDLIRKPEVLAAQADRLRAGNPWTVLSARPERIVLLGMGSSTYAAGVVAARLRARGLVAVAERASQDRLPHWGAGTLVVLISASGESKETLDALARIHPEANTVALTNQPGSSITRRCERTVLLQAQPEVGGVACRSYQHTLALLLALEAYLLDQPLDPLAGLLHRTAEASADLLSTEPDWRPEVSRLLVGPDGSHLVAPARRLGSAQQAALMLREGPRRSAIAAEAGDWAHVDVYLTKNTDYRLLVFAGSAWDSGILEWTRPRRTTVVAVGGEFEDAAVTVRYRHDEDDDVRLLTEVLAIELVAARLWLAGATA